MSNLRRINLIAGWNNSGKSSLLEAVFWASFGNHAQALLRPNLGRFIFSPESPALGTEALQAYWKLLFRNLRTDKEITVTLGDDELGRHRLTAALAEPPNSAELPLEVRAAAESNADAHGKTMRLAFEDDSGETSNWVFLGDDTVMGSLGDSAAKRFPRTVMVIKPGGSFDPEQSIGFGKMSVARETDHLLSTLKLLEPRLVSLHENVVLGVPAIWGDIGLPELVPLTAMGDGMVRTANLVIALWRSRNGLLLIDEFESGLHHSVLRNVWSAIGQAAERLNVQIIATTHSLECVDAAAASISAEQFRFHRLEQRDGRVCAISYEPDLLEAAFDLGVEVR